MCFRPAEASVTVFCPECGKRLTKTQGFYPKKCPFCKSDISDVNWEELESQAAEKSSKQNIDIPKAPPVPNPEVAKPLTAPEVSVLPTTSSALPPQAPNFGK